jgi:hypothetical protein
MISKPSLVSGGAYHALLGRLGMLEADRLPSQSAALILALAAWLIPVLAAVAQSLLDDHYSGWGIFTDATVYARYLIAIWAMIVTERYADCRINLLTRQFREAQLITERDQDGFTAAMVLADRRSASVKAEAILLLAAVGWSLLTTRFFTTGSTASWEGTFVNGVSTLSWAGDASAFLSNPLFLFLVLRWFWRLVIWATLLGQIAKLRLQLMPLHPDRVGGLGFLATFPNIFSGLIFALSCVISAAFIKALTLLQYTEQTIWLAVAIWLATVLIIFLGPLLVFLPPLYNARERGLLEYGRLAHHHHLAFHRKWIADDNSCEEILGSPDPSSVSDLNGSVQTVLEMGYFPIDRAALVQLLAAVGVPLLAVVISQIPLVELLKLILGVIV